MFWLRACPRCQGDLYLEVNEYDDSETYCVQCGFRKFGTPVAVTRPAISHETQDRPVMPLAA